MGIDILNRKKVRNISEEVNETVTDEQAMKTYEEDKKALDDFTSGKTDTMDFYRIQRLVLSEMTLNKNVTSTKCCGFTRKQIQLMVQAPERFGKQILRLMDYMYQKSGYMRRIVDYFSNMAKLNYYVDTEVLTSSFFNVDSKTLQKNYVKFSAQSSKFNLSNIIHDILKRLYLNDVCYAYVIEEKNDISYFFLDPKYCKITGIANGNVYKFAIDRSLLTDTYIATLPTQLQQLLTASKETSLNNLVDVPYENSLCIKYNTHFLHLYPPFFPMIADILMVDDYEDLAKSKAINDAYKLLILKVPTKDGKITMSSKVLEPFVDTALKVVNDNIGVLPYPDDVDDIEFASSSDDDNDTTSNAISRMYEEQGVSQALMAGASSGSELKLSITNDSGDIFRIYRMLENWVSLQMKLRSFIYPSYQFVYRILDITIFNWDEVVDEELKLAQASLPNKARLCAAAGISPAAVLGNTTMENVVFADLFDSFMPLKSSYTTSSDEITEEETQEQVGTPTVDDDDLSPSGEAARENDTNNPDNRV